MLKNLAMSDDEAKEMSPMAVGEDESSEPKYPYGLCLCLDEATLKKLGIKNMPEVGQVMMISAKVQVKSVGEYESMHGGARRNMDLQITDLEILPSKKEVDVNKLYDSEDEGPASEPGKMYGKLNDNLNQNGG